MEGDPNTRYAMKMMIFLSLFLTYFYSSLFSQHFFYNIRKSFRIPEAKTEVREIIDDVLGIVDAGYAEVLFICCYAVNYIYFFYLSNNRNKRNQRYVNSGWRGRE